MTRIRPGYSVEVVRGKRQGTTGEVLSVEVYDSVTYYRVDCGKYVEYFKPEKLKVLSHCEHGTKLYHDKKEKWYCPFCIDPEMIDDYAPVVFDEFGNPMKVRVVGAECIGEVSGEGHWGYEWDEDESGLKPTVWFEDYNP